MGGTPAQTRSERVLEHPIEPPLSEGYTPVSDEGRLKLHELMTMCTKLSKQVLDLEKEKDAQAVEILRLKKRVKRLERQRKSSTSQPRRRKYGQVESLDDDLNEEDASKHGRKNYKTNPMLHESDFDGFDDETVNAATTRVSIVSAPVTTAGVAMSTDEPRNPPTTTTIFDDKDVTMAMAQTLIKMKEEKAKEKKVFKFDISGLLHHVIMTIAYRIRDKDTSQSKQNLQSSSMTFIHKTLIIPSVLDSCFISSTVSEVKRVMILLFQDLCLRQELLEYMNVHDNDASESSQPSWGKMCTSGI
ncbi:hypothetical protein Tco_0956904 [Tanacetum coccineum]